MRILTLIVTLFMIALTIGLFVTGNNTKAIIVLVVMITRWIMIRIARGKNR